MLKPDVDDFQILSQFLRMPTPKIWLETAINQIPLLLVDHAHCERKAAANAINFMSKHPEKQELVAMMSPLAREELLHFEKVMVLLKERGISYGPLTPPLYAQRLHQHVTRQGGNDRLSDQLIVGAIIEARSCERFKSLAPLLADKALSKFYTSLVKAEARHFQDYLRLAHLYGKRVEGRIAMFLEVENELISSKESEFRFHSGLP